jgi:hypothetical protein
MANILCIRGMLAHNSSHCKVTVYDQLLYSGVGVLNGFVQSYYERIIIVNVPSWKIAAQHASVIMTTDVLEHLLL